MNSPIGSLMPSLTGLAVFFAISIAVFLLFRALVLWYWKIDEIVSLLRKINENLQALNKRPAPEAPTPK
ncbi:MAG: hypothetical protein ACHQ2Z_04855 [Elusimicrobiota bacterium]